MNSANPMQLFVQQAVDTELLRMCLYSRKLQVVYYNVKPDGMVVAHVIPV
jgi:hypothetical protein